MRLGSLCCGKTNNIDDFDTELLIMTIVLTIYMTLKIDRFDITL